MSFLLCVIKAHELRGVRSSRATGLTGKRRLYKTDCRVVILAVARLKTATHKIPRDKALLTQTKIYKNVLRSGSLAILSSRETRYSRGWN